MAGTTKMITAPTKTELRKLVQNFTGAARKIGWGVQLGWDPERVMKTEDGWEILVRVHS